MTYSRFVMYVDESGDHGLASIDPQYPLFVLSFCIFDKEVYTADVVPRFQRFKFRHFGHDLVILHGHEIRKAKGDFKVLFDQERRHAFVTDLTAAIEQSTFTIVAAVIDKRRLLQVYRQPVSPYDLALTFCMERAFGFLRDMGQRENTAHVIVESRGRREDDELELVFRRVVQGANRWGALPFELVFARKSSNSTGLQIADLVSHPIGRSVLEPRQPNRAYAAIEPKLRRSPAGVVEGWGLKRFP